MRIWKEKKLAREGKELEEGEHEKKKTGNEEKKRKKKDQERRKRVIKGSVKKG